MSTPIRAFDLILETTPDRLGKWLLSETAMFPNPVVVESNEARDELYYVGGGQLITPTYYSESPHLCFELYGIVLTAVEDDLDKPAREIIIELPDRDRGRDHEMSGIFETNVGRVIWIELRELVSERVQVVGEYDILPLADYTDCLRAEMVRVFKVVNEKPIEGIDRELREAEPMPAEAGASDILPAELTVGGKYGTCRDLTIDDVRAIVAQCRAFQEWGGKVPDFCDQLNITPGEPRSFELETLRGWLKDPKFAPQEDT